MSFSSITPKILIFEYYAKNKTFSELNFICVYQIKIKSMIGSTNMAVKCRIEERSV